MSYIMYTGSDIFGDDSCVESEVPCHTHEEFIRKIEALNAERAQFKRGPTHAILLDYIGTVALFSLTTGTTKYLKPDFFANRYSGAIPSGVLHDVVLDEKHPLRGPFVKACYRRHFGSGK